MPKNSNSRNNSDRTRTHWRDFLCNLFCPLPFIFFIAVSSFHFLYFFLSLTHSLLGGHNGLFKLPTAADAQCRRRRRWLDRDNKSLITKIALMNFFVAFKKTKEFFFLFLLLYLSNGILFCVSNLSWSVGGI